jgi:geranylgeranyl pyrophosphate synthase
MGLEQAQQLAALLYTDSLAALDASGLNTTATAALRGLATQVVQRKN